MEEEKEINLFYFRNLLLIALADGKINNHESDFLRYLAVKLNLSNEDYQYILTNIDQIEFIIPNSSEERIKHFKDLLSMMVVDGEIHPEEYKLVLKFGGYPEFCVLARKSILVISSHKIIEFCLQNKYTTDYGF